MKSIRELYRIGTGPSSSHTMGPRKAAEIFLGKHPEAKAFQVTLYGSLAATGKGHMTDVAILDTLQPHAPTEIIWKVGFTINSYGGALGRIFANYDYQTLKPDYVPALWVLNSYDANDLRATTFFQSFTTGYDHALTWPLLIKYFGNEEFTNYRILHVSMPKSIPSVRTISDTC